MFTVEEIKLLRRLMVEINHDVGFGRNAAREMCVFTSIMDKLRAADVSQRVQAELPL